MIISGYELTGDSGTINRTLLLKNKKIERISVDAWQIYPTFPDENNVTFTTEYINFNIRIFDKSTITVSYARGGER